MNAADPTRRVPTSHVARLPVFDMGAFPILSLLGTRNLLQHGVSKVADAIARANTLECLGLRECVGEILVG